MIWPTMLWPAMIRSTGRLAALSRLEALAGTAVAAGLAAVTVGSRLEAARGAAWRPGLLLIAATLLAAATGKRT
jgi:hypothetical protein